MLLARRKNVELAVDKSAYCTSILATMRVGFVFPHAAAIQKIVLDA